jgi:hypothetical protein
MPVSAGCQARPRADRGQPADKQNLEQPTPVVGIGVEYQLDPRRPCNRDRDHQACQAGGG